MEKNNLTGAQITAVIIQVFCASSMLMGLWRVKGFFVAVLLVILAILFLKPSIDRRKKIRSTLGMTKSDSLDGEHEHGLLLFLLLLSNAIMVPLISEIPVAPVLVFLLYLIIAGVLFYVLWKRLGLRN
jgi:membrane protein implicated in regulation of membrane protease activity